MSTVITKQFSALSGRKALIPYLTAGYPDKQTFGNLLRVLYDNGADLIEIGIPFSDPLADGKTIQYSSQVALNNGITIDGTLEILSRASRGINVPFVIMTYFNPVLQYIPRRFISNARQCGVSGLIIPDLIPEEGREIKSICHKEQIDLIYLAAPTSHNSRLKLVLNQSSGFVYLVTIAGVTGSKLRVSSGLKKWIKSVRNECRLPICAGFGISGPGQARQLGRLTDGVIIGSAIINVIRQARNKKEQTAGVGKFMRGIRKALDGIGK